MNEIKCKNLENTIYSLEKRLLDIDTRSSADRIAQLLSEDFFEFCSSGNIWYYSVNDVIESNIIENTVDWEIKDFKISCLSEKVVLATYISVKGDTKKDEKIYFLRSSICKCFNGIWKMVFHQGTPTKH